MVELAAPGKVVDKPVVVLLEQDFVSVSQTLPQTHAHSEWIVLVVLQILRRIYFPLDVCMHGMVVLPFNCIPVVRLATGILVFDALALLLVNHVLVLLLPLKERVDLFVIVDARVEGEDTGTNVAYVVRVAALVVGVGWPAI